MNSEFVIRFMEERPFVPFIMYLVDGRTLRVPHPDFAMLERFAAAITVYDDEGYTEVVDSGLIVSFRTMHPKKFTA
jgi:hypothetical protein